MVAARDEAATFSCKERVRLSILLMDSEGRREPSPSPVRPLVMRDSDCWRSSDGLGICRTLVLVARMLWLEPVGGRLTELLRLVVVDMELGATLRLVLVLV